MTRPAHVQSYYAASAHSAPEHPPLEGSVDCDVCVVGAGITGNSAALHLAERGYSVVVLEAARVGWGASGRSGGQMLAGYACPLATLRRLVGPEATRRLWDLSLGAVRLTRDLIARHGIDCDLTLGHLQAALKPRHVRELREWQREMEDVYGYEGLELWEGEALRRVLATERYPAGLYDPQEGHLHPLNYNLGLARAAQAAGARYFENARVLEIRHGTRPEARTAQGRVRARHLILCGNAYLGEVAPRLRARIMPVGTYIGATEPLGEERARALIANGMAVTDSNFVLDYFRLSADHRMLFGGRVSYSTVQPPNLPARMRSRMLKVFPQLADLRMDYAWGGFVDISMNRAPDFGRLDGNVYYAQGFSGHGIALTALAGRLMAEAVAGDAERFDLFARIPHRPFPGGRFMRMPILVLAMLYYRLRDLL